jgi:hypothetical protein
LKIRQTLAAAQKLRASFSDSSWIDVCGAQILAVVQPGTISAQTGVITKMDAALNSTESEQWIEDLGGLGLDELRDLPYAVQAGMDIAVFE